MAPHTHRLLLESIDGCRFFGKLLVQAIGELLLLGAGRGQIRLHAFALVNPIALLRLQH